MINPYIGQRVFVYFDLRHKCWSLKSLDTGLVLNYTPQRKKILLQEVCLEDCVFRVSQAGRARVLATGQKNVHAGVIGTVRETIPVEGLTKVRYNPKLFESFVEEKSFLPVYKAGKVVLKNKQVFALLEV